MPPRLDLTHSTHAAVMVAPPRINLRRAASYNNYERGPLSSTSSRFSFNHLLFSPPPSPSLPALVPRPKKSPTELLKSRPSRVVRRLIYLIILIAFFYGVAFLFRNEAMPAIWPYFANDEFEMVGQDVLPDFPTPVIVSDPKGRSKWTVSIPPNHDFPLSIQQYSDMSGQCREVSARARDLHHKTPLTEQAILNYDAPDDNFVDIYDAELTGMLPFSGKGVPVKDTGHFVGLDADITADMHVCESSMTFVLESSDAGLGNAMMMMWTFYGLAKEQNRAFFIDDSRWAYGKYADMFQPPPIPDCRPPPRHQIVPCPFQARHLVVSSATAKEVFPALLAKHHRISHTGDSLRDVFELARTGYSELFKLNIEDRDYVGNRVADLRSKAKIDDVAVPDVPIIGLHIRHGDQHPLEYQYRNTYIPAEVFLGTAQHLTEEHYKKSSGDSVALESIILAASDDPTVYKEPSLSSVIPAQERIRLASKEAIENANHNPHLLHHFVDEAFGWEGGFFAPIFWNLGVDSKNNAANAPAGVELDNVNAEARLMAPPSEQTLSLRGLIGRAYLMDLAVLAGASDNVVCAVSAMGCRLLALMMGWEASIDKGAWVNVDGDFGWTGINW